jgi:hypothetical protein
MDEGAGDGAGAPQAAGQSAASGEDRDDDTLMGSLGVDLFLVSSGVSQAAHHGHFGSSNPDICDIFSPPRVTSVADREGLRGGRSLDLTTDSGDGVPWDFDKPRHRDRAMALVKETRPMLVIGSPPCTCFSQFQRLNVKGKGEPEFQRKYDRAVRHMQFVISICHAQRSAGRFFLLEQPAGATSWDLKCVRNLAQAQGVSEVRGDVPLRDGDR